MYNQISKGVIEVTFSVKMTGNMSFGDFSLNQVNMVQNRSLHHYIQTEKRDLNTYPNFWI